jgi:hypothetical protein
VGGRIDNYCRITPTSRREIERGGIKIMRRGVGNVKRGNYRVPALFLS